VTARFMKERHKTHRYKSPYSMRLDASKNNSKHRLEERNTSYVIQQKVI